MGIGSVINKVTGASNTAKESYKYSNWLAAQQNQYQQEAMQNAHQWEVDDLQKAGLNPVLSAGGTGANAGGVGGGATVSANSGATGLASMLDSARGLMAMVPEIKKIMAETNLTETLTGKVPHEIEKIDSETKYNNAKTGEVASSIMLNTAKALEARMNAKYRGYFPKTRNYTAGGSFSAGSIGKHIKGPSGNFNGGYGYTDYAYVP